MLKPCRACGKMIGDHSDACPYCGQKTIHSAIGAIGCLGALVGAVVLSIATTLMDISFGWGVIGVMLGAVIGAAIAIRWVHQGPVP